MLLLSQILLLVKAVCVRREFTLLFSRVAFILLLYSRPIVRWIGVVWGLFQIFLTQPTILACVTAYRVKIGLLFLVFILSVFGWQDSLEGCTLTLTIIKLTSKSSFLNPTRNLSYRKISAQGERGIAPLKIYSQITPTTSEVELIKKLTQLEARGNELLVWSIIDKTNPNPVFNLISRADSEPGSEENAYNSIIYSFFTAKGLTFIKEEFALEETVYQALCTSGWVHYDLCLITQHKTNSLSSRQQAIYSELIKSDYQNNPMPRTIEIKVDPVLKELAQKSGPALMTPHEPVKVYYITSTTAQSGKLKWKIRYDNRHKSGIYRWYNRVNGKSYIGSSRDLESRFNYYFNLNDTKTILLESRRPIVKALLRHTLYNFNLEILTYCSPKELLNQEKYYIHHYQPEYNVIKPHSNAAFQSDLAHMSPQARVKNEPPVARPQPLSMIPYSRPLALTRIPEIPSLALVAIAPTLQKATIMATAQSKRQHTEATKAKISLARQQRTSLPRPGFNVQVEDLQTQITTIYPSILAASHALGINDGTLSRRLRAHITKPYKKRYVIRKV